MILHPVDKILHSMIKFILYLIYLTIPSVGSGDDTWVLKSSLSTLANPIRLFQTDFIPNDSNFLLTYYSQSALGRTYSTK